MKILRLQHKGIAESVPSGALSSGSLEAPWLLCATEVPWLLCVTIRYHYKLVALSLQSLDMRLHCRIYSTLGNLPRHATPRNWVGHRAIMVFGCLQVLVGCPFFSSISYVKIF